MKYLQEVNTYCAYYDRPDQGLLEFIWTEGYSGQSSNPGLAFAL